MYCFCPYLYMYIITALSMAKNTIIEIAWNVGLQNLRHHHTIKFSSGHSRSSQHTKSTPLSDFFETWYIHSMGWVIQPQQFLVLVMRLLSYKLEYNIWPTFCCHILGKDCFYVNQAIQSCSILNALLYDMQFTLRCGVLSTWSLPVKPLVL